MIVVTAPTSQIASQVLTHLLEKDAQVRVVVRDPSKLPEDVRDRVDIVAGSHGDADVVDRALDGADAVFWLLPSGAGAPDPETAYTGFTGPAAEALARHGVARVVDVTALGRGTPVEREAGYVTASLDMDDLLGRSAGAFRGLACPSFMDNRLRDLPGILSDGVFRAISRPDLRLPFVATRDIAANGARLLLDDSWTGVEEVPLLGPEGLSMEDLAHTMSETLETPVRYEQVPVADFAAGVERFMPQGMARGLVDMMVAKDEGLDLGVTRTPEHALATPTTFREWCETVLVPAARQAAG